MLTKTELKTLWKENNFKPNKRLGQIFLIDKNIRNKILENIKLCSANRVVEIGAGFGEFTFELAKRSKKVYAVEKDKKIAGILKNTFEMPENLILAERDFLDLDMRQIAGPDKLVVYGSLPYYITSPIIEKLFEHISLMKAIYILVQKEVAERIIARPGSKDIGRLSLFVQYYTEPKVLFKIGKESFYPTPQVSSVFLKLEVLQKRRVEVNDEKFLFEVIKAAYSQRRKTLLNALYGDGSRAIFRTVPPRYSDLSPKRHLAHLLQECGIDPKSRPETLSLQDFARIANTL